MSYAPRALAAAVALLAGAGASVAQSGPTVAAAGGWVDHAVAGGTTGTAVGLDATFPAAGATVRVGYRRMLLDGNAPDTDALRATARYPALEWAGVVASGEVHAGLSRFSRDQDSGIVLAGGVGLHVTPAGAMPVRPYLSARGLGGFATGTVLDESYSGGGLATGVEAGVGTVLGPLVVWLRAARDGFDGGLGATPYPTTTVELSAGFRF